MKTKTALINNTFVAPRLFYGLPDRQNYIWKNIIIEKQALADQESQRITTIAEDKVTEIQYDAQK